MIPKTIVTHAAAFVAGGLAVAVGCAWVKLAPSLPSLPALPAPELAGEAIQARPAPAVQHFASKAKTRLGLPEAVRHDKDRQVTASTRIPPDDRPRTVTSVFDFETGKTELYVRRDPLPWFAPLRSNEIGLAYGFKDDHDGPVVRVQGQAWLLQMKALRAGFVGSLDSDGDWYAGVGFAVRF